MSKVFTITEGLENMGAIRTGGQGSVYKARRYGPILSAVKLLPTPIADESIDDKNYRRFVNEVEKLKKVNEVACPNVVKILSSGITESGSLPFIEMEFIEGPDLCDLLSGPRDKIFPLKETIKLADQLAGAIAHCHRVGVKHGDIKSNNVKFNVHTGNYVLLDFGLSIMSDEARRSSMRHAGAIEFMAPEQNAGQMLFQTDIYSFGVVLFEMLTGTVPFPLYDSGETARNTVMVAHMERQVPDLLTLRANNLPANWTESQKEHEMRIPAWLVSLVYKCLEKVPESRFGNGMDLHEAIIKNSVSTESKIDNGEIENLKVENERLKAEADQLKQVSLTTQQQAANKLKRNTLIAGSIIIFLLASSLYGLSTKKTEYVAVPAPEKNYIPFPMRYQPKPVIKPVNKDSILKAHKLKLKPKPKPVYQKKKPKRKKFLGIF